MSLYTLALGHELLPPVELNLLGERLVLSLLPNHLEIGREEESLWLLGYTRQILGAKTQV